ncbi:MAG: DUF2996 domain-containing protein [Cyanobacteria bacterium SID2]|nr:DUF2996 domain-containing protein [Cyanobacteria bacterium SID2]MBP0004279.1 DUF2996 domain-containing protein [Cyanobacteria bacterium SBC]
MAEEAKPEKKPAAAKAPATGGKAKAKKEKPPALEDKPFADFMHQDYLPALKAELEKQGIGDLELKFEKQRIMPLGLSGECWQVIGSWQGGKRRFVVYFPKADIKGPRAFSCSTDGTQPSTIEPFLMDERRITLQLLVFGVVQRLNAQKWLAKN